MSNGGGIGTDLATMTSVDRHRLHRGDHTTVREKETEIYASVIGIESGIGIWAH